MTTRVGILKSYNQNSMKKWWSVFVILAILLVWFLLTADCVISRFTNSGIPVDWANIKDCSY